MDILDLDGLTALEREVVDGRYLITCEPTTPRTACPQCGAVGDLARFGRRATEVADLPNLTRPVTLRVVRRRWRCRACGRTSLDDTPFLDDERKATRRLIGYVQERSLRHTFVAVAEEVGVTEGTVRNIFAAHVKHLSETVKFITPKVMGLDELHLLGQYRCILTNVEERTIFNLLPTRDYQSVYRALMWTENRYDIRVAVIDMWKPYKDAVTAALEGSPPLVVVDKFHVVRMANAALESVRREIRLDLKAGMRKRLMHERFLLLKRASDLSEQERLKLDVWLETLPQLAAAYRQKEAFYGVWDAATEEEAREKYREWRSGLTLETEAAFRDVTRAVTNWETEVFNYWKHPVTNAYTEAVNGLVKIANRLGRGYSFDVIRAKLLYTKGTHRRPGERPIAACMAYNPKAIREGYARYEAEVEQKALWSYGADLSTLASDVAAMDLEAASTADYE